MSCRCFMEVHKELVLILKRGFRLMVNKQYYIVILPFGPFNHFRKTFIIINCHRSFFMTME